jgi:hypothetical protein
MKPEVTQCMQLLDPWQLRTRRIKTHRPGSKAFIKAQKASSKPQIVTK